MYSMTRNKLIFCDVLKSFQLRPALICWRHAPQCAARRAASAPPAHVSSSTATWVPSPCPRVDPSGPRPVCFSWRGRRWGRMRHLETAYDSLTSCQTRATNRRISLLPDSIKTNRICISNHRNCSKNHISIRLNHPQNRCHRQMNRTKEKKTSTKDLNRKHTQEKVESKVFTK